MAKKAKKRGVKPGTKRGNYRKRGRPTIKEYVEDVLNPSVEKRLEEITVTGVLGNTIKLGDKITFSPDTRATEAETKFTLPARSGSFADCMLEIINSNMDQATKTAAFNAMSQAASNHTIRKD